MAMLLPQTRTTGGEDDRTRIAAGWPRRCSGERRPRRSAKWRRDEDEIEFDAAMTFSDRELLQEMDFEKMSIAELAAGQAAIARMRLPIMDVPTRRFAARSPRPAHRHARDPAGQRCAMPAAIPPEAQSPSAGTRRWSSSATSRAR